MKKKAVLWFITVESSYHGPNELCLTQEMIVPTENASFKLSLSLSLYLAPLSSPPHPSASADHKQTHSCRNEAAVKQSSARFQECAHIAALSCYSWLMVKSELLFFCTNKQLDSLQ